MSDRPTAFADAESCVEAALQRVGRRIRLGAPLGLGKANHLINEFFRRAREDPRLELRIFTALTLARPRAKGELERRFIDPLSERLFGGYPELAYVDPLRDGTLPDNIRVTEFYFQPGSFLNSPLAQQQYVSSNYTHVVRDLIDAGINVLAQLVARAAEEGDAVSLSCNPDLTLDLAPRMRHAERHGAKVALLAQVNRNLPFMHGDAVVSSDYFDALLENPEYDFPLFAAPNLPVSTVDYLIALHASALIRDGGTLQLGIGSLGDAITYALKLRQERNEMYRSVLSDVGVLAQSGNVVERLGGIGRFEQGIYAATEMLVPGFLELYRCGVLRRRVAADVAVQKRLDTGSAASEDLTGTHVAHACFFLGPQCFYDAFRTMERHEREQFCMTGIGFVNQLHGQEELKRLQRKHARFVNTGLIVTLSGAVNSDALEDGRVISGVGGQYNFVTMAQALEDGRSILLIRSTRDEKGTLCTNIRGSYGSITIPRHLRDIVVTEYGIADVRGRTDEEVATALIEIADSRFQDALLYEAQQAGKISEQYCIADSRRQNRREKLEATLAPYRAQGLFRAFPFGTDLTHEEIVLKKALEHLQRSIARKRLMPAGPGVLRKVLNVPDGARPYLERMRLDAPRTFKERLLQKALAYALASVDAI
jgi:acyl-CoA hydrolase